MDNQQSPNIFKNIWSWIALLFAGLAGALVYTRGKKQEAESKLANADADKKSAIIDNDRAHLREDRDKLEDYDKKISGTKVDSAGRTDEDVVDFYKKK